MKLHGVEISETVCRLFDRSRLAEVAGKSLSVVVGLVAFALFAFGSCEKNEPIDEAKAAGLTTVDFPLVILVS
jgi:hypothetical protein